MFNIYHSQSQARQRSLFLRRNEMWVRRGACRWIPKRDDEKNEGKRCLLNDKVRIGDCRWESIPASRITTDKKLQLWQDLTKKEIFSPVTDPVFEARMKTLPVRLQQPPILETIAPHMEEVTIFLNGFR